VPADKAAEVARLALERGAGLIHITPDTLPNPYDTLPDDDYMQTVSGAIAGGDPLIEDSRAYPNDGSPSPQPSGLSVASFDYSSVTLSWSSSGVPLAFMVFLAGKETVRLPGTMTQVTTGNLEPGLSGLSFYVKSIGGDGTESAASNTVTSATLSVPDTVVNVKYTATGTTTIYQADILVPYAFLRVFITDLDTICIRPAWPINYNPGHYICTHYMLEDETLYKYAGTSGSYDWVWAQTGDWANVGVQRSGYTYTWTLPIGTDLVDPSRYVVQAQGYGPLTNVFVPCPSNFDDESPSSGAPCIGSAPYDCKGETLCSTMQVEWCDDAVTNMVRGSKIYT
jgi:hypothetical protein